jgi:rhamnose transport system permease protein
MGTIRSDVATGYELEAISMVVLGGISTAGGKGNFPGTVISIFTVGLLRYASALRT